MTEINNQTFLTALPDEKQLKSLILNDDDGINAESSNDFEYISVLNDESEEIINREEIQGRSSSSFQNIVNDGLQNNISNENPPSPPVDKNLETIFSQSVFDYATMLYEKSEGPNQNKLNHDINAILGSSDPPPGFGFLHPRFYYLTQKRPIPMEPLRVCID